MRRASGKLWISVVVCCCSLQLTAAAQQRKPAVNYDDLVASGVKAFETGDYTQARALFEHAHRINPNARTLRGMGLAAFQAKHYALAGLDFERALADTRQPLDDAQRDELERLQGAANAATARFRLKGQQPGAVILIDGEPPLIDAGGFVLMDAGTHTIKLQLA
ncbi:MAG TPA: hypothetical protein VJR89_17465, partial [Polyangiales bacterium]|nr:hypothetical protein [Polyangiales bacterium]